MNFYSLIVSVAHIGATVAAVIVAIGSAIGFHDMTGSWFIAVLGGTGIASILGLGWFALITAASKARRMANKAALGLMGVVLFAIALGTSGWALATAIGGKHALASYQVRALDEHRAALTRAMSGVSGQSDLVDLTRQTAVATRLLAEEEGRSGQGPNFRSYLRTEENLLAAANDMQARVDAAAPVYAQGTAALDTANRALGNSEDFHLAMTEVQSAVLALNSIDIRDDILSIGMVGLNDRGLPELTGLTQQLRDGAETMDPPLSEVPTYRTLSRSEATLSESPLAAWIPAIAIDVAPLLLLLIVMLLPNEPLLREEVRKRERRQRVSHDEIRTEEENIIGFQRAAAE